MGGALSRFERFRPDRIETYPLSERESKVGVGDFARPVQGDSLREFFDSLPDVLAVRELRELVRALRRARDAGKGIVWGFGGHVIKVGLAPLLIDLMERGWITALATNGSGMIHDFEIALCGSTSEDVERELSRGAFGMARETGEMLNRAAREGAEQGLGLGEAVGRLLAEDERPFGECSVFLRAHQLGIPVCVFVAFGTDIVHNHPDASGAAVGRTSQVDFEIFTHQVSRLDGGGVYLNLGSAVILPEVFLKAVALVRNSGIRLGGLTTANLDFIQHYRPTQNVIRRPTAEGGRGIALTGHHEIMVPLLAAMLRTPAQPEDAHTGGASND